MIKSLHWASVVRVIYHLLVWKTLLRNHLNCVIRKYIQPRHNIPQGQYKLSTYLFSLRISQCLLQKPFTIQYTFQFSLSSNSVLQLDIVVELPNWQLYLNGPYNLHLNILSLFHQKDYQFVYNIGRKKCFTLTISSGLSWFMRSPWFMHAVSLKPNQLFSLESVQLWFS